MPPVIQHVSVEVRREQVDACADFWGVLGFRRVDPPPTLAERAIWVERDGTQVHLMYADDPVVPPKAHVAVVVDDYERAFAALAGGGHDPEPRPEHWGVPRCFVHDPAGHRVEVMAAPPTSAPPAG
jgi:catechol 2,3-dioxygenase-like lactoylglutathione lyase family enzyme